MVQEILEVLAPAPGAIAVDCTLGYGGHAQEILGRISPGGRLLGLDADPIELPKTEARLRSLGYGPEMFSAHRSNFAGLQKVLAKAGLTGADFILADLGVSSMQIDDPSRGFSTKHAGPLDMRMNPGRGQSASAFLRAIDAATLARLLEENADEPQSERLASALAGKSFPTTLSLGTVIRSELSRVSEEAVELSVRRVFQALRIEVNDEFSALDSLLRQLPSCLNPGGRVAILTFHSGEDRRVKKILRGRSRCWSLFRNLRRRHPPQRLGAKRKPSFLLRQTPLGPSLRLTMLPRPVLRVFYFLLPNFYFSLAGFPCQTLRDFAKRSRASEETLIDVEAGFR